MPELVHECGKRVRFPSGTEGRKGKCPHCGGSVRVPEADLAAPRIQLDPPPHWSEYEDYLYDRGPAPRPMVLPSRLMLQSEADERWERRADVTWSRFVCPNCRERIAMEQVICTKCGVDFRTGLVLGQNTRLNEKGMAYLDDIPWVKAAREELERTPKAPRKRRPR